jgi:hypothetical protein
MGQGAFPVELPAGVRHAQAVEAIPAGPQHPGCVKHGDLAIGAIRITLGPGPAGFGQRC